MKRLAALAFLLASTVLAHAAGTINLSLSQQFDSKGNPLSGCKLYFYQAGTTNFQNAYQDTGLTLLWPNPMSCDASGRLSQFFLADLSDTGRFPTATQYIKIRLTDKGGVTVLANDNILIIGPSGGSGSGGGVDQTTVAATGDIKSRYDNQTISGWVRANGRTIGSASSGASERANADCQALFEYLWQRDNPATGGPGYLTVSGGRGSSANADWLANKTITLPDLRGRVIAGDDAMGATAIGRLPGWTALGIAGGVSTTTLAAGNLPVVAYTPGGSISVALADPGHNHTFNDPGHAHGISDPGHSHTTTLHYLGANNVTGGGGGIQVLAANNYSGNVDYGTTGVGTGVSVNGATTGGYNSGAATGIYVSTQTFTGTPNSNITGGSSTPFNIVQPSMAMNVYIKL